VKWSDKGIVLGTVPFSESEYRLSVLTHTHGRQSGLCRRPRGKSKSVDALSTGDFVDVTWNARLSEHLGRFVAERTYNPAPLIFQSPVKLWMLQHVCDLIAVFPERHPYERLFYTLLRFVASLPTADERDALKDVSLLEKQALMDFGFGIDLTQCCVTEATTDLRYISPRTGRAVSQTGAGEYVDRLLPLPEFWLNENTDAAPSWSAIESALMVTGHFYHKWIFDEKRTFIHARDCLVSYCKRKNEMEATIKASINPI
jgi:DNA repair protein RecO (recombination protein O)